MLMIVTHDGSQMICKLSISNRKIYTRVKLPSSKSLSNRALIINALHGNMSSVRNLSDAQDTHTLHLFLSPASAKYQLYNVGNAGTCMRFLTAYFAVQSGRKVVIDGDERMRLRPIGPLVKALCTLGAKIDFIGEQGYPPIAICGKHLKGGTIEIDGSLSSQFISALLMISPYFDNGLHMSLKGNIVSKPYINMTLSLMKYFGAECVFDGSKIMVKKGGYKATTYIVEHDWSSASYWYEIAALSEEAEINLPGLYFTSRQGDAVTPELFSRLGVESWFDDDGAKVIKKNKKPEKRVFSYDFTGCPDLAQTIAVTCAGLGIIAELNGVQSLKIKETDRLAAIKTELLKLNADVEILDGSKLVVMPEKAACSKPAQIQTYNDHRMALAFAPLVLKTGELKIEEPDVVAKSYPGYWDDLRNAGFGIEKE